MTAFLLLFFLTDLRSQVLSGLLWSEACLFHLSASWLVPFQISAEQPYGHFCMFSWWLLWQDSRSGWLVFQNLLTLRGLQLLPFSFIAHSVFGSGVLPVSYLKFISFWWFHFMWPLYLASTDLVMSRKKDP